MGEGNFCEHQPVMLQEVVEILRPVEGMWIVDGTFGRGGHAVEFLKRGASVWALDQDAEAVASAKVLEEMWGKEKLRVEKTNFRAWAKVVREDVDGIFLDLGVSSPQLDYAERGFSFQKDAPLDMRMDLDADLTAAEVVNMWDEAELAKIFHEYGEERQGRRIARAIVSERKKSPFKTTLQLAEFVSKTVGGRRGARIHPATRVFQALRIAVNDELDALREALEGVKSKLKIGGRLAVLSFHSLEDRIVKEFIGRCSKEELRGEGMAFGFKNPNYFLKKLGDWAPSAEEVARNPRARSARLRAAERVAYVA